MKVPNENLNAMIQFLTDISETSGDHFMVAAWMLQVQQARITELETKVAIGRRAVEELRGLEEGGGQDCCYCSYCGWEVWLKGHAEGCKLDAILRDAEQAGMGGGSMSDIEKRLRASVGYDAINGDSMERAICGRQMLEAANYIQQLQSHITKLETKVAIGRKALESIALWPDGGNNYGQPKIKEFAVKVLAEHAAVGEK